MEKGRVHSGLTRVIWELNPVTLESGGTRFLTGSHKSAFVRPEELSTQDHEAYDTYQCPAGSCVPPDTCKPFRPCSALCFGGRQCQTAATLVPLCFRTDHRPP